MVKEIRVEPIGAISDTSTASGCALAIDHFGIGIETYLASLEKELAPLYNMLADRARFSGLDLRKALTLNPGILR